MRVAIIDHVGIKAGMDCYDLSLAKALSDQGCETFVYSNFKADNPGVFKVFQFKVSENFFSYFRMLITCRRISRQIADLNVQQCIVHGFRFGIAEWMMIKLLKRTSIKMNMIVHDPESLLGKNQSDKWRKKILELCDTIIVHNNYSADELSRNLDESDRKKMAVIPHGHFIDTVASTDVEKFKTKNLLQADKKYLLFFGHIKRSKGLDLLLNALAHTNPAINLIIAGRIRKHSFDEYMSIIEKNNLHKRVKIFSGYVSSDLRNELFQVADAVVLPYRKVFQSGVMLMAMSYGKAVIASDLLPNREVIEDGKSGFLFKTDDEVSLTSTMEKVMGSDILRNEVAKSGRNYVEAKHDWNSIASQWIKLFSK